MKASSSWMLETVKLRVSKPYPSVGCTEVSRIRLVTFGWRQLMP